MAFAATRSLRTSNRLHFEPLPPPLASSSSSAVRVAFPWSDVMEEKRKKQQAVVVVRSSSSEPVVLGGERANRVAEMVLGIFKPGVLIRKSWPLQVEMIFETGCFLVVEAFCQYLMNISKRPDGEDVIQLLVEALDVFLVGNAALVFGVGIYAMFMGLKEMGRRQLIPGSNLFGFFQLERVPSWVDMRSLPQAKSRMGHSLVVILQAGLMEKLKNVAMATPMDLACLAGAILFSSATIFLLSKLSLDKNNSHI